VRDNGVGLRGDVTDGIGLSNTRERLVTLFGANATVELRANPDGSGATTLVDIPWRTESA
jgi:LytS/YehU family sensor histidine kinase